jgi:hypothetical protein
LTSGRRPVVKIIAESLSQHDEKHVVPTPLSGIRVGGRRICIAETRMWRLTCGDMRIDKVGNEYIRESLKVPLITKKLKERKKYLF